MINSEADRGKESYFLGTFGTNATAFTDSLALSICSGSPVEENIWEVCLKTLRKFVKAVSCICTPSSLLSI